MTVFSKGGRLLVVVAHPDDETFGCGSLLLHAAAAGMRSTVCCATRGEAGEWPADLDLPPGGIAAQREAELRAAADELGVDHVELLDFADSGMVGPPGDGTLAAATDAEVVEAVRTVAEQVGPDVLVTLDGSDGHRDHGVVRDATVRVGHELGVPVYLHCLARRLMQRWVEVLQQRDPSSDYLALGTLGTPDERIDLVLDTSAHLDRRERAIALHVSQTSPYDGLPLDLRREWLPTEHLVGPLVRSAPAVSPAT